MRQINTIRNSTIDRADMTKNKTKIKLYHCCHPTKPNQTKPKTYACGALFASLNLEVAVFEGEMRARLPQQVGEDARVQAGGVVGTQVVAAVDEDVGRATVAVHVAVEKQLAILAEATNHLFGEGGNKHTKQMTKVMNVCMPANALAKWCMNKRVSVHGNKRRVKYLFEVEDGGYELLGRVEPLSVQIDPGQAAAVVAVHHTVRVQHGYLHVRGVGWGGGEGRGGVGSGHDEIWSKSKMDVKKSTN